MQTADWGSGRRLQHGVVSDRRRSIMVCEQVGCDVNTSHVSTFDDQSHYSGQSWTQGCTLDMNMQWCA